MKIETYQVLDAIAERVSREFHIHYIINDLAEGADKGRLVFYRDSFNTVKEELSERPDMPTEEGYEGRICTSSGYIYDDGTIKHQIHHECLNREIAPNKETVNYIIEQIKQINVCSIFEFEKKPHLIALHGSILDRNTGTLERMNPFYLTLNQYDVYYDKDTKERPIHYAEFLNSIFERPDGSHDYAEMERFERMLKSTILGWMGKYKRMWVLLGPANSGKGVISRIVRSIVGGNSFYSFKTQLLGKQFEMSGCLNKRILCDPDCKGGRINSESFSQQKNLTGKDPIRIEPKGHTPMTAPNWEPTMLSLMNQFYLFPRGEDIKAVIFRTYVTTFWKTFDNGSELDEDLMFAERNEIFSYLINCVPDEKMFGQLPCDIAATGLTMMEFYERETDVVYKIINTDEDFALAKDNEFADIRYIGESVRNLLQERINKIGVEIDLYNQDTWKDALNTLRRCKVKIKPVRVHSENITVISNIAINCLREFEEDDGEDHSDKISADKVFAAKKRIGVLDV
jgi:hypothetical protein